MSAVHTPMSKAVAISVEGVSKRYALVDHGSAWRLALGDRRGVETFDALKDIGFEVPKGRFVGVLGRNGAGKSTLLRVIGGVYAPDRGRIAVKGALSGLYELGLVGHPELTGRQYADRLLTVHGFGARSRAEMLEDIQDFSELGDRFDDPVLTYSAGMMARLFFSTATAGRYEVYLLDEILSVGDQHFQAKCWRRLRDRVSDGASGVLVTHDWSAIVRMCETAHVLDGGRITYTGPSERAARLYLYGEQAKETYEAREARFVDLPSSPVQARAGEDLRLRATAELTSPVEAGVVFALERLQTGYGWETALMSRSPSPVGATPGRYDIDIVVPALPLEAGDYQIALHLVAPDPVSPGRRRILDGRTWLNGDGITLRVEGGPRRGLAVPARWSVEAA